MPTAEDFPLITGSYRMSENWSIFLPEPPFQHRIDDGSLVLWRPGLTIWIYVWGNDLGTSPEERLSRIQRDRTPKGFDEICELDEGVLRCSYRLWEDASDDRVAAFYAFAIGATGHVQMAIYFDTEDDRPLAEALWRSLQEHQDEA